jgi:hypothetical protein
MTIRRVKTYTAETGQVYQYYFVGDRPALDATHPATEYIFDVIRHDHGRYAVSVFLTLEASRAWEGAHGRSLVPTERYACAKLRLLKAFDELEDVARQGRELRVDSAQIEELLAPLNLE